MKQFTDLFLEMDRTTRTNEKVAAMKNYFLTAPPADAAWAVYLMTGRKIGRTVSSTQLRNWISETSGYAPWLVDECYHFVGDLSETLSLLVPGDNFDACPPPLHVIIEQVLRPLGQMTAAQQRAAVTDMWTKLSPPQRLVFHKLLSREFRIGASRTLVIRALAEAANVDPQIMAHRLAGNWKPTAETMQRFLSSASDEPPDEHHSLLPYPFMLAHPLGDPLSSLGDINDWLVEWKWDGIRAQLIRRNNQTSLWSRGDEDVTGAFPEIIQASAALPNGTVLDGEVLAWDETNSRPLPFAKLQRRLNRKNVELSFWPEVPVRFIAFDALEIAGVDQRGQTLDARRTHLKDLLSNSTSILAASQPIEAGDWNALEPLLAESRDRGVEGFMIKKRCSLYQAGRPTGLWWKLKIQPYTMDVVLVAAQPGHGRRAGLFTDYTFGVWNDSHTELVPIAKAYSGLTDAEMLEVDGWVRRHTVERFGPVHAVEPTRVFELGFEAIQRSTRHKSGIAVRFPRILRERLDKKPADADTLPLLRELLKKCESP